MKKLTVFQEYSLWMGRNSRASKREKFEAYKRIVGNVKRGRIKRYTN